MNNTRSPFHSLPLDLYPNPPAYTRAEALALMARITAQPTIDPIAEEGAAREASLQRLVTTNLKEEESA